MATKPSGPLLTTRAAVILLLALVVGVLAGVLSYLATHSAPTAVLVGGTAAGGALALFHSIIDR